MNPSLLLAILASSAAPTAEPHRYVVSVGYNQSDDPARATLRYADDDAARFFELLAPASEGAYLLTNFDAESQALYADLVPNTIRPTLRSLEALKGKLAASVDEDRRNGRESELYFFYAGHGAIDDGVGYVNVGDGRLRGPDFRDDFVARIGATRTHVVIDACKSYYFVVGRGPGGTRKAEPAGFATPRGAAGVGYVLSTSSDADAHEWSELSGGVFSHEVRSALVGGADANGDGHVDYAELGAFVAVANEAVPYPSHRPRVFVQAPTENRRTPFLSLEALGDVRWLRLTHGGGRMTVRDERGLRYADLNATDGSTVAIALAENRGYDVEWNGQRYHVPAGVERLDLSTLSPDPNYVASRGELHRAFSHLFDGEFGADVVRGYELVGLRAPIIEVAQVVEVEKTVEVRAPHAKATTAALVAGGVLAVAASVLLALAADKRGGVLPSSSQTERESAFRTANGLTVASAATYTAAATAFGLGFYLYWSE